MTAPIQWTETGTLTMILTYKWRPVAEHRAQLSDTVLESRDATSADLKRAIESLPPDVRAEVVGRVTDDTLRIHIDAMSAEHRRALFGHILSDGWIDGDMAARQAKLAAAIARAESAERERDEEKRGKLHWMSVAALRIAVVEAAKRLESAPEHTTAWFLARAALSDALASADGGGK